MTETQHTRSRAVSLFGLILQALIAAAVFGLAALTNSRGLTELGWYVLGGLPVWFIALLVYRQHELADLEAMDLEELRREKRATGGGEALFDEEGGMALGFRVAAARLEWMLRWVVPAFGLGIGAFLLAAGAWRWMGIRKLGLSDPQWAALKQAQLGLILLSILMLAQFFFARYASGMGRLPQWQLLRACGSYALGNSIVAMALMVSFGAHLYQGIVSWERLIAHVVPILMMVLGVETLLNFVLDRYRPRTPGTEPRAAFDSRLIGLVSEPGGIAHSLAEAINYQFGFRVSQTWFYQLLQRAALPLTGVGVVSIWLLSCLVVVWPHERGIVERFGRQLNADRPLEPGVHLKWPAPFELARKFNTDQLQVFYIGYKEGDQPLPPKPGTKAPTVELWTDDTHSGRKHFDFLISPPPAAEASGTGSSAPGHSGGQRAAVNLIRLELFVQYQIDAARLADYTRNLSDPATALRVVAWDEVARWCASTHIDALMGEELGKVGELLAARIARRADELRLGLKVVRVGLPKVHPEKSVAETFRKVVTAQLEKVAEIRKARVTENEVLSQAAGDRDKALALHHAIDRAGRAEQALSRSESLLRAARPAPGPEAMQRLDALEALFRTHVEAGWRRDQARQQRELIESDLELGLGRTLRQRAEAEEHEKETEQAERDALASLNEALEPIRRELAGRFPADVVEALIERKASQVALSFWNRRLEADLAGLEGEAAVVLARAQATRWQNELRAAGEVTRLLNEKAAYEAAPRIYESYRYLEVLVSGIQNARKYFLAFEPDGRTVHLRLEAQEQARPDITEMPVRPGGR